MNHTTDKRAGKPVKSRDDFPILIYPNGQWPAKIRGKPYYFDKWADPDAALNLYLDEIDYLRAGRTPAREEDGLVVGRPGRTST